MSLLEQASLVITPNAYKTSKLYSVIPNTTLGDMDVVRATTATRVNSAGLIEVVPRNLLTYSEQIDNAAWSKENTTITSNAIASPIGTLTAELLTSTSASFSDILQSTSQTAGSNYTLSCYAKKGSSDWIFLRLTFAAAAPRVWFNVNTGTIGTIGSGLTATIESVGNGWFRCSITGVASLTPPADRIDIALSNADSSTNPNIGNSIYVWGAQLDLGSTATEYFPTTTRLNIPRIDYTNGSCPSLLVEPQRTNLALYSEQFENANWYKNNVTVTANSIISPSGTLTADTFTIPSAGYGIFQVVNVSPSSTYTFSFYAKKGTNTSYILDVIDGSTFTSFKTVDYSSQLNSNWVRVSATFTTVSTTTSVRAYLIRDGSSVGNGYFWGAQLEAGSYPTSYIPTVATSVTRNADVISKTGISSLIGQTEGTLFLDFNFNYSDSTTQVLLKASQSNDANSVGIEIQNNSLIALVNSSSSNIATLTNTISTGRIKCAIAYKSNDMVFYVNGSLVGTDTSGTINFANNVDMLTIGHFNLLGTLYFQSSRPFNSVQLYKTRLSNTELAQLTTL